MFSNTFSTCNFEDKMKIVVSNFEDKSLNKYCCWYQQSERFGTYGLCFFTGCGSVSSSRLAHSTFGLVGLCLRLSATAGTLLSRLLLLWLLPNGLFGVSRLFLVVAGHVYTTCFTIVVTQSLGRHVV